MTEVAFYHLTRKPLERAMPELLEKVVERDLRCVVLTGSAERVSTLNDHLWTWDKGSFLPHGAKGDGEPSDHPIWLTTEEENPNGATVLMLIDGCDAAYKDGFDRCLDMFNGLDEEAVAAARDRFRAARDAGHTVTYWKQNERGGWEKGA
ncbi:DNA polymerase III subunit chi [Minwuia sp.]|uniref:DNA polymerase III subunit chi n=1 Tax=Minwuia sp. TaxID=2493630 RepID=UPI003A959FE5